MKKIASLGILAAGIAASIAPTSSRLAARANLQLGAKQFSPSADQPQPERQAPLRIMAGSHAYFPGVLGGGRRYLGRGSGMSPKDWGMSAACRRMVRHNRMRRAGIGGARI